MRKPRIYLSIPMAASDSVRDTLIKRYPQIEFCWWDKSKPYDSSILNGVDAIAFVTLGNLFKIRVSDLTSGCKSEYEYALKKGLKILGVYRSVHGTSLYNTDSNWSNMDLKANSSIDVLIDLKNLVSQVQDSSGSMKQSLEPNDWYIKAACMDEAEVLAVYANTLIRNKLINSEYDIDPREWSPDDAMTYYLRIKNGKYYDGDREEDEMNISRKINFIEFLTIILPSFEKQFPYAIAKHNGWNDFLAQYDIPTESVSHKVLTNSTYGKYDGQPNIQHAGMISCSGHFLDERLLLMS